LAIDFHLYKGGGVEPLQVVFSKAGAERGVPLLRQPGRRLRGADEVDRSWVGEFRALIPVGAAEPAGGPDRVLPRASRAGLGLAAPGGVFLEERTSDRGIGDGGEDVGAVGGVEVLRHAATKSPKYLRLGIQKFKRFKKLVF
jgi:hypothetical protein